MKIKKYLTLHQHFYEDTLTPEAVKQGARVIKQISKGLRSYFNLSE